MSTNSLITDDEQLRGSIATKILKYGSVTLGVVASLMVIGGVVLFFQKDDKSIDKAIELVKSVFNALLPVISAWVGTVIAFFFGKANFESASKSAKDLIQQFTTSDDKLRSMKVLDANVMIPITAIAFNKDILDKEDSQINIKEDLLDFADKNEKGRRLPIFKRGNGGNLIRYIIHESTLNEFARKLADETYNDLKGKKLSDVTLDQMIKNTDEDMKNKILNSVVFVSRSATLLEARDKMVINAFSQDIFVTEHGLPSETVDGWITNNTITDAGRL